MLPQSARIVTQIAVDAKHAANGTAQGALMSVSQNADTKKRQMVNLAFSFNMGWTKGIEPSTTGVTIPCSTN